MPELVRPYRGISPADRQTERRGRLIDACLTVIGRDGLAATTVGAVAEEAGLTKRYFYESFPDLDAILLAALDGLHTSLQLQIRTALDSGSSDLRQRTETTIGLLVAQMDDPRMARLYTEADGHPKLHQLRQGAYEAYIDLILTDVFRLEAPTEADRVAALVNITGITQAIISWLGGRIDLRRDELIAALTDLATAAPF